ncbi:thioredoxin family protein, partial [bacterium]|nr:thioredoxin family protein [bacterium]
YEEAQLSAIEQGKPILAGFTGSDWCRPCKQLKTDVLDSEEFVTWAGGKVVLLELDYPKRTKQSAESKEQNEDLKQRYQISKYPTILLLDQDGEVLGEIDVANNTATAFIENAESILSN